MVVTCIMDGSSQVWRSNGDHGMALDAGRRGRPPHHIGIDRWHGLIRTWITTDASRHDGAVLPELIDRNNTASEVWADTAYRSQANEKYLPAPLLRSQIHRKKPRGKPMPRRTARANGRKSKVRAAVEHVFARQKGPMGLLIS